MRNPGLKAVPVLLCTAFIVAAGASQAGASLSDLFFPSDMFVGHSAYQTQPENNSNSNFFAAALSMVPNTDNETNTQIGNVIGTRGAYDNSGIRPTSVSRAKWMSNALASGIPATASYNPAMNAYDQMIGLFPNQSNIYAR